MRTTGAMLIFAGLMLASSLAVPVGADTSPEVAAVGVVKRGTSRESVRWTPGELLVRFRPTLARDAERDLHAGLGARVIDRVPGLAVDLVRLPGNVSVREGLRLYFADPAVAVAEPNFLRGPLEHIPNDELFGAQWGLRNTGQLHPVTFWGTDAAGTPGADISVTEAWDIQQGSPETIIAVLDDGVDIEHPDIAANVWSNPDEIPNNNVDDDDNGYIDDVHGWDFAHNDNTVDDVTHPGFESVVHGTHVAGIAAAAIDNDTGTVGVCPRCTIMPLKTDFTLAQLLEALDYARRMGADIVNGSYGGFPWSRFEYAAFRALGKADVLAVLAAGNDGSDNDVPRLGRTRGKVGSFNRMYPASYGLPNILSVAATDHDDEYASSTWCEQDGFPEWRCTFTNWGAESVDLAAPGADVLSTVPDGAYKPLDGTSMATPHVAGMAGLVKSQHPNYGALEIKNALMNSVDHPPGLETLKRFRSGPAPGRFTRTNGRLNALGALDGDTRETTKPTDGTIEGATWIDQSRRGSIAWPEDPMDVFKKRLAKARYKARLKVPEGRDYRMFVWAPGIKEIWQIEGGCYALMPEPWFAQDGCKLLGWSDHRERGRDEVVEFRARRSGVHYLLVNPWVRSKGNYELNIVGVRSISISAGRARVRAGRRTRVSGRTGHPDCPPTQRVRLQSKVSGRRFRTVKKTWIDHDGAYSFRGVRIARTKSYRTVIPRTTGCTKGVSRTIKIRTI